MTNKRTKIALFSILFAGIIATVLTFGDVSAQGPTATPTATATSTTNPKLAPATATTTNVPPTKTNTPQPKVAPATATLTKAPPTLTLIPATLTRTPTKAAPTATKVGPTVTPVRQQVPRRLAPGSIPGPSGTFGSAFTIQNMAGSVANCSYQFFDLSGTPMYSSAAFTISVGGSNFTYVPNIGTLGTGQYSGVVSCDQQVAAVVNTGASVSGGSYGAISTPATTWYAPNAFNNYFSYYTNFVVQNASSSPVDIVLSVINGAGTTIATQSASSVPANGYQNFEQTGLGGLGTNVAASAKITATGNIAVESNIFGSGGTGSELYMYAPFSAGSTTTYAPVIMNNYFGYSTALTVQNIGGSSTQITVTYGSGSVQTTTLSSNAGVVFFTPSGSTGVPNGMLTSAKVQSSSQPLVALVNEANSFHRAASYSAFAAGTSTVKAPIVLKRYFKYSTSVTCQNIGSSSTTMTITYSNGAFTTGGSIAPNGTQLFFQPNDAGIPNGFNGSATITSTGSVPIVCIVNEDQGEAPENTTSMDQLFSYEGINQ